MSQNDEDTSLPLIRIRNLVKHFPVLKRGVVFKKQIGVVHAVDGVSFDVNDRETLGLVGESGCGKTTTARLILGLEHPSAGSVYLEGQDILQVFRSKDRKKILTLRRKMQMVFQNPYQSLNPRMTVYDIISEPFRIHNHLPKKEWSEKVYELLKMVGLEEYHAERYPHEFSGGQRQRICIARALAVEPKFIVADEPVSSLDASIRAQILGLLSRLQKEKGIAYLYISHDLSSVRQIAHKVAVMYLGKIVELAETEDLFERPLNPYTQALFSAVPIPDPKTKVKRIILHGEVPSAINPPLGCRFHPRCPYATEICRKEDPPLVDDVRKGHLVSCHYASKFT